MEVTSDAVSGQPSGNTGEEAYNSIDDAISAAITASEKVQAPVSKVTTEEPEAALEKAGEARDGEDAKAAVKEPAEAKDVEAPAKDAPTFEAPKHWPEADRQAFAKMPPEGQAVLKRLAKDLEGGFTRKSQELGDKARYADTVRGLIDDTTRQQIAHSGVNEVQYFDWLHKTQQFASSDPVGYLKWAMQSLRVSPDQLGLAPPRQPDQPKAPAQDDLAALFQDPRLDPVLAELNQIKGKLSEREQAEQHWRQQQELAARQEQSARLAHIHQTIESARTALDDSGQLKFPHFDAVRKVMSVMLEEPAIAQIQDPIARMEAAYKEAVWARPDLRTSFLDQEASKKAAAIVKAQEAQRARSVTQVKPGSGVVTNSVKPKSLDDIISQAMGQHGR
jgi:hypothetical protein